MMRFTSPRRPAFAFGFAGALLITTAAFSAELSQNDFLDACEDGGFGAEQSTEACDCSYDYLTSQASDLLRQATFILVDEGQEAQAEYLQGETGGDQAKLVELAGESEAMMDACSFADE